MAFKEYWDTIWDDKKYQDIKYDDWLNKYSYIIDNIDTCILDLGCGVGNDTLYLIEKNHEVLSCDYSEKALEIINKNIPNSKTRMVDISKPFSFEDKSFDLIIADLSLHYFDDNTTRQIMMELKRILKTNGYLLARVNSVEDLNHGANQGEKIEDNYYYVSGYNKRFFNSKDIIKYFSLIGELNYNEEFMYRYTKPKKLYEICVKKIEE